MKLAVVAAVLVVLLACVVALEAAPSAREDTEVREAVERQVKRELEEFKRALLPAEDPKALYRRGWFKKIKKWFKKQAVSAVITAGIKYVAGSGKRNLDMAESKY